MKTRAFLFFLLLAQAGFAQNLVQNGSFEDYTVCPDGAQIERVVGWENWFWTPDYFHACAIGTDGGVPSNIWGQQLPFSGNGYTGFFAYWSPSFSTPNVRDHIAQHLQVPLEIGARYNVSMRVNLASSIGLGGPCAANKIGIKFTTQSYQWASSATYSPLVNNDAHIYTSTLISDTTNWVAIEGSFVADSAYQYMVIGGFFDDAHTDTLMLMNLWDYCYSYYYLDEVIMEKDTLSPIHQITKTDEAIRFYIDNTQLYLRSTANTSVAVTLVDLMGRPVHRFLMAPLENKQLDLSNYGCTAMLLMYTEYNNKRSIQKISLTF